MNVFADWVAKQWKGLNILRPCNRKNPPAMEGLKVSLWNITDGGRWELTWINPCSPPIGYHLPVMGWSSPVWVDSSQHQFLRSGARLQGEQAQRWKHLARWTVETQPDFCATYVHHPTANGWLAGLHSKQRTKKITMQKPRHYTHHTEEIRCHSAAPSSASSILQDLKWMVCSSWIPRVDVDHPLVVRPKIRLHSLPPRLRLARENKMARKMGSSTGVGNSKGRVKLCSSHSNVWKCM